MKRNTSASSADMSAFKPSLHNQSSSAKRRTVATKRPGKARRAKMRQRKGKRKELVLTVGGWKLQVVVDRNPDHIHFVHILCIGSMVLSVQLKCSCGYAFSTSSKVCTIVACTHTAWHIVASLALPNCQDCGSTTSNVQSTFAQSHTPE